MKTHRTKVVELRRGDPDRERVIRHFQRTCPHKRVLKVERVQHPALWKAYVTYRDDTVAPANGGP